MLKREQYIKRIIFCLSHIQAEVEANNDVSFFDINHIAEDVICGLLNLIYGWKLENENHRQQNAVAVDLTDRKNRIAVQVTSNNTRDKIQDTINKFISHNQYQDFDQLYILLLTDKMKNTKPFDTGGFFSFSHKQHILDTKDLIKQIKTLDTAMLEHIVSYLDHEVDTGWEGHSEDTKTFRRRPPFMLTAVILAVLVVGITAPFLLRSPRPTGVYLSKILPYTKSNYFTSYKDVSPIYQTEIETYKAFSILSFVRSDASSTSIIENQSCHILNLNPIEEPILILDAVIADDTLKLFAFNDGWGTAKTVNMDNAVLCWNGHTEPIVQISNDAHIVKDADIAPAGAVLFAEFSLDREKFQNFNELYGDSHDPVSISIEASGEDCSANWSVYLILSDIGFNLDYGGRGDSPDEYGITLFAVLDVDSKPSMITFTGPGSTPRVEDTLRVETVLAPTKSCVVTCRNEFSIDGTIQQTDVYTATVTVPAFTEYAIDMSGPLTRELAELDALDEISVSGVLQKYSYDPECILHQYH